MTMFINKQILYTTLSQVLVHIAYDNEIVWIISELSNFLMFCILVLSSYAGTVVDQLFFATLLLGVES